ncbi:MAG: hypothetical protein WD342_00840 [Verrucomicrobiales bacterium]
MSRIRVIHAPEAVAGQSAELAAAERRAGLDSEAISLRPHPFGYGGIRVFGKSTLKPPEVFAAWFRMFFHVLRHCDVLHLNFGRSIFDPGPNMLSRIPRWSGLRLFFFLLQRLEFLCYRVRGIVVFVTYQGDDVRQGDRQSNGEGPSMSSRVETGYYTKESDAIKRCRIRFFARQARRIYYLNPDLARVTEGKAEFLPYASVNLREWGAVAPDASEPCHLVHAPSHRGAKGTEFVLEAVQRLRDEGIPFRFSLVEGKTRQEARAIYESAHLVVDQLLAGWYGGLAVECMALGRPVIARIREEDLDAIPPEMRRELPLVRATPDTLGEVLREWLRKPAEALRERGDASRKFVEKWHDPDAIAIRMKKDYEEALEGCRSWRH